MGHMGEMNRRDHGDRVQSSRSGDAVSDATSPHPRVITKIGPAPTRPPAPATRPYNVQASSEESVVAELPGLAREQLIAKAVAGSVDPSVLSTAEVQLLCVTLIDALVCQEAAEHRLVTERAEACEKLKAERARSASLSRQLALKINSFTLTMLDLEPGVIIP